MKKTLFGLMAVALLLPTVAMGLTVDDLSDDLDLGTADLEDTVINIVQWALGFLGLIAVIMILVGGFQWMTAGGNEEKVASAKKIISSAVIGLIIILLAWAIVIFVVTQTTAVTN